MNIYVGNLNYSLKEEELQEVFEQFGEVVSVKIIKDRETGRSKGFGFVEFSSEEEAERAMQEANEMEVGGRKLRVNPARERTRRPSSRRSF